MKILDMFRRHDKSTWSKKTITMQGEIDDLRQRIAELDALASQQVDLTDPEGSADRIVDAEVQARKLRLILTAKETLLRPLLLADLEAQLIQRNKQDAERQAEAGKLHAEIAELKKQLAEKELAARALLGKGEVHRLATQTLVSQIDMLKNPDKKIAHEGEITRQRDVVTDLRRPAPVAPAPPPVPEPIEDSIDMRDEANRRPECKNFDIGAARRKPSMIEEVMQ